MWHKANRTEEIALLPRAIKFTGNAELYGLYMRKVAEEWPFSSEHNLTDLSINRRAWIGHAATCIAIGCPEYITRRAWWELSVKQQDDANHQADLAINEWEMYHQDTERQLCLDMG
jgi:hypothetical protein